MHVYIVHGFDASPAHHWFPWLKQALQAQGHSASVVELPSPHEPDPTAWVQALQAQAAVLDRHTWFVAHSLGCIAVLRHLEQAPADAAIGGYVLVSGFNAPLAVLPQLDAFAKPDLDTPKLAAMAAYRSVIASSNDAGVPPALSQALAKDLDAKLVMVERGGHFLASEGFTEFPLVLDELERASQSAR
ncbi:RBBP9/YdeN family alpha/beta hydrolase [Ideonella sp. BN130291]|uniref:RBBP9/YdeN family alpha/beta hydrolase n=1 Tax=Ideonella sp. BN130291 TaxID=3112940 RepID=UPI002E2562EA|nr:alpha/beta hydrolase [Ideonella sp. BN130291]